ncbi:hypothetical protein HRG_000914 [Hirsutella rhossiliensis]|uniref:DUF4097 domain-containing protein n=1 Tax=Hirsutella rhossiliensis TaxID=111463 RepID=A0A9P8N834_9HYPO|nr:uncharacterized protein HRG_00914 [Hirsutella rhossiliensis]KAH0968272.1 hypothetical protein HRG_00914 [Hirsutella rhossiliensis]
MGVSEKQEDMLLGGYHPEPVTAPTPKWLRVRQSMGWNKRSKTLLGVFAGLSVVAMMLSGFCSSSHKMDFVDSDPVRQPDLAAAQDLEWKPKSGCRNTPHAFPKFSHQVRLGGGQKFGIRETLDHKHGPRVGRRPDVSGQIILRPASNNASEATVDLEIISNDEDLQVNVEPKFHGDNQRLIMAVPHAASSWSDGDGDGPCIQIRATFWVPRKAYLRRLSVESVHLDVDVMDGLTLGVSDETKISTVVGRLRTSLPKDLGDDVVPYTLQSRKISIETVSAPIEGWFPLYDRLRLASASGDITAQVAPKPGLHNHHDKARLEVSSVSGKVSVQEPLKGAIDARKPDNKLPARPYVVKFSTVSGNVDARLAANCDAQFKSVSGELSLELLPVLDKKVDKSGSLKTDTRSGDVRLTVLEPVWVGGDMDSNRGSLGRLRSKHQSISGDLKLSYPPSWHGSFTAKALAGEIEVHGKDVEIIRRGRSIARFVEGRKGDGDSCIKVETVSGDLDLTLGE